MKRLLCSLLVAISLLMVFIPAAGASDEWCEVDPPVQLTTLSGKHVVVFVTDAGQLTGNVKQDAAIRRAVANAETSAQQNPIAVVKDGVSGTEFTIYVAIPGATNVAPFAVRSTVGSRPFQSDLAGPVYGTSGSAPLALTVWLAN